MSIDDGLWEGIKYIWQGAVAILSAVLSYTFYRYKQQESRLTGIENNHQDTRVILKVFEERLNNIINDIEEIKSDIKKVLFRL